MRWNPRVMRGELLVSMSRRCARPRGCPRGRTRWHRARSRSVSGASFQLARRRCFMVEGIVSRPRADRPRPRSADWPRIDIVRKDTVCEPSELRSPSGTGWPSTVIRSPSKAPGWREPAATARELPRPSSTPRVRQTQPTRRRSGDVSAIRRPRSEVMRRTSLRPRASPAPRGRPPVPARAPAHVGGPHLITSKFGRTAGRWNGRTDFFTVVVDPNAVLFVYAAEHTLRSCRPVRRIPRPSRSTEPPSTTFRAWPTP